MLERSITQGASMAAPSDTRLIDLEHLVGILLRQSRIIAICVALGLLVGFVVLLLAPRSYHAASQIIIEGQMDELAPDLRSGPRQLDVEGQILNQMEVIGSSRLARIVAEAESLTTDAVFLNPPPTAMEAVRETVAGLLGQVTGNPRPQRETVTEAPMETVTGMLRAGVNVSRVGRSSVIWLCFESHDAELAYRIANAYATAFVQDQLNADLEVTREAADWLRERLTDLGTSQQQAALEVEQFRQESGLTMSADTDLTVRRLQLLTDQIGEASAKVADLQAVVSQLERVDTGDAEQVVSAVGLIAPESASNDAVASLREAYVRAERRIVEISGLYGEDHPQVVALRQEQRSVGLQLSGQLHALLNRYRSELRVAQSRVQELEAQVDAEGRAATETNQALIQLTALQQRSDALNVLYRSYLTRYEETIQAQSFPIPAARVISDASLPNAATGPRTIFTLAAALIFGGFLGLALSALNELRERSFRLGSQVTRETGLRFLGYMNALPGARTGDKAAQAGQVQQDIRRQIERRRANLPSTLLTETLKSIRVAAMARWLGSFRRCPARARPALPSGLPNWPRPMATSRC
jgi:succinoglycan biosynthesis transport protein ExoP